MQEIVRRFITFDELIGPVLVKIIYWVGAGGIVCGIGLGMLMGVLSLAGGNFGGGFVQMIAVPAVGLVALVYWRFLCELFMLAFRTYERLGEVRDKLPDYSHF